MNLGEIEAAMRSMDAEISEVVVLVTDRGEPRQAIVAFCQPSKSINTHNKSLEIWKGLD
jgi:hypothetical protein